MPQRIAKAAKAAKAAKGFWGEETRDDARLRLVAYRFGAPCSLLAVLAASAALAILTPEVANGAAFHVKHRELSVLFVNYILFPILNWVQGGCRSKRLRHHRFFVAKGAQRTMCNRLGSVGGRWHDWDGSVFMARPVVFPAPGRGSYDRSLTRAERDAEHRERLLRATAEVLSDGPLTVARIVQRAGVGRSTFYEFFDSPEHLLEQLEQRLLRQLEAALAAGIAEARTPLERLRAIARSWVTTLEERGVEARVVMGRPGRALLSPPGELLYQTLQRVVEVARREVGWFKTTDDVSVLAAAAAGEAISRRHLTVAPLREAPRLLAEVMIKLLR